MFKFKMYNNVTGTISCYIDGKYYCADKTHPGYNTLIRSFKENDHLSFVGAMDVSQYVKKDSKGNPTGLVIEGDKITWNGHAIDSRLQEYIANIKRDGFPIDYVLKFVENLMQNPSGNSINQLWSFLANKNMPIDDDGAFIAYKTVVTYNGEGFVDKLGRQVNKGDFVDKYSKTYRNNVGDVICDDRNQVDDNPNNECSFGFHVGGLSYSGPGGTYHDPNDPVIIVKVFPQDAVAVPKDKSFRKMRVCKYEVIGIFEKPLGDSLYNKEPVRQDDYHFQEDYEEDYEEDEDDYYDEDCDDEDDYLDHYTEEQV